MGKVSFSFTIMPFHLEAKVIKVVNIGKVHVTNWEKIITKIGEGTTYAEMILKGSKVEGILVEDWVEVRVTCVCGMGTTYAFPLRKGKCRSKWRINWRISLKLEGTFKFGIIVRAVEVVVTLNRSNSCQNGSPNFL